MTYHIKGHAIANGSPNRVPYCPPPAGYWGPPIPTIKGALHPHQLPDKLLYDQYPYVGAPRWRGKHKQRSNPNADAT